MTHWPRRRRACRSSRSDRWLQGWTCYTACVMSTISGPCCALCRREDAPTVMDERARTGEVHRQTGETDVRVRLDLDGGGEAEVETGVPFLDHMLTLVARHGRVNLLVRASGDI